MRPHIQPSQYYCQSPINHQSFHPTTQTSIHSFSHSLTLLTIYTSFHKAMQPFTHPSTIYPFISPYNHSVFNSVTHPLIIYIAIRLVIPTIIHPFIHPFSNHLAKHPPSDHSSTQSPNRPSTHPFRHLFSHFYKYPFTQLPNYYSNYTFILPSTSSITGFQFMSVSTL